MKPILCTLFDSAYLAQGMALLRSVAEWHEDFAMYVLALDERAFACTRARADARVRTMRVVDLENELLRRLKAERSRAEYCWTLTPFLMGTLLNDFNLPHLAYLDADCFLFHPLDALYNEVDRAEIAIVPHRFPQRLQWRAAENGTYNVSWVYLRNGERAQRCAAEWSQQCADWCAQRTEHDAQGRLRFGDQGYLDEWVPKYGAHVVQHLGANLAPWNQEQYSYRDVHTFQVSDGKRTDDLLFYHFHGHRFESSTQSFQRGGYRIVPHVLHHVYRPYEATLLEQSIYLPN